jgi:DNA-3-methyladenine glycosylase
MMHKLPRTFYARNTIEVARDLLGKYLVHVVEGTERIGRIVETEAYVGTHDLASHSSKGITSRTKVMFGPPGFAYVYLIYGVHHCMNVVTESEGQGAAVLLRALEPIRHLDGKTSGPGLLCKAMRIDLRVNMHDLLSDDLYIADSGEGEPLTIIERPRIGVDYAGDWAQRELRFYIKDSPWISRK